MRHVPVALLLAALPAFLVEITLYFLTVSARSRAWLGRFTPFRIAVGLVLSSAATYLLYSVPLSCFRWQSFGLLFLITALVSAWYLVLPRRWYVDVGFVLLMAGVVISKIFARIYVAPHEDLPGAVLGQVMWIRLGVVVALCFRRMEGVGLGVLPKRLEWTVGLREFLYFIPIGIVLSTLLKFRTFSWPRMPWWLIVLTFLGMLWVVALSEEFFFRGLLLQWLRAWSGRETVALALTSVLFGMVHLPFGAFPNWRFAIIAAVAGWFYGRAYLKTGSIRSAMVSHALTNVTWKAFFG